MGTTSMATGGSTSSGSTSGGGNSETITMMTYPIRIRRVLLNISSILSILNLTIRALVDRVTWEKAQERGELNTQFPRLNAKPDYLLSELMYSSYKLAMSGEFFRDHRYYWKS